MWPSDRRQTEIISRFGVHRSFEMLSLPFEPQHLPSVFRRTTFLGRPTCNCQLDINEFSRDNHDHAILFLPTYLGMREGIITYLFSIWKLGQYLEDRQLCVVHHRVNVGHHNHDSTCTHLDLAPPPLETYLILVLETG